MRLLCISCRCEVERIEIARSRVVAVCVACEAYGDAAELVAGVRLDPAERVPHLRVIEGLPPKPAQGAPRRISRKAS